MAGFLDTLFGSDSAQAKPPSLVPGQSATAPNNRKQQALDALEKMMDLDNLDENVRTQIRSNREVQTKYVNDRVARGIKAKQEQETGRTPITESQLKAAINDPNAKLAPLINNPATAAFGRQVLQQRRKNAAVKRLREAMIAQSPDQTDTINAMPAGEISKLATARLKAKLKQTKAPTNTTDSTTRARFENSIEKENRDLVPLLLSSDKNVAQTAKSTLQQRRMLARQKKPEGTSSAITDDIRDKFAESLQKQNRDLVPLLLNTDKRVADMARNTLKSRRRAQAAALRKQGKGGRGGKPKFKRQRGGGQIKIVKDKAFKDAGYKSGQTVCIRIP